MKREVHVRIFVAIKSSQMIIVIIIYFEEERITMA